jgi:hypothetical protein|nr:MAG TPA: hypothetical protein [Caudoviricetes sp.]
MAYEKTVWVNGQAPALDAEHLNKIEQGIADAVSVTPQVLSAKQQEQARENITAANGTRKAFTLDKKGWYRIATCVGVGGGILTLQHNYGSGGPSSLKFLVTLDDWVPSLKCIDTGYYSPQITNARIVHIDNNTNAIDIYYNINFSHDVGVCFIQTGRDNVAMQKPSYISDSDALPNGETLLAPMEYLNPPMALGVEYRTTERYMGKPVYAQLIDCGYGPNNSNAHATKAIENIDTIVRWSGTSSDGSAFPFANHMYSPAHILNGIVYKSSNVLHIDLYSNENKSGVTLYVSVFYTKNPDQ